MRKTAIIICVLFSFIVGNSQIKPNEKLIYAASYNMSGLMTHLAQVTLQTETLKTSKKTYLHLSCEAATFSKWDNFFKIRDLYESYVDPITLRPNLYNRNISEGGYIKSEKYIFKPDGRTIISTSKTRKTPKNTKTFKVGGATQDVVSILYKLRTIDFKKIGINQTINYTIVFDEKEIPVTVKFMGTETVDAGNLGKLPCYKVSIAAKTNALRGKDKNLIWLTADNRKIPALIKFSIPVGTGQLALSSASGI